MKKIITLPFVAMLLSVFNVSAQENTYSMVIKMNDGTTITIGPNEIESISFSDGEVLVSGESIQSLKCSCLPRLEDLADRLTALEERMASYQDGNNTTDNTNSSDGGTVIYQSPSGDEFYCNGYYSMYGNSNEKCQCFEAGLSSLNVKHFKISFDYTAEEQGCILVLSHLSRMLGIYLRNDEIVVYTWNFDNKYTTNISQPLGQTHHIDLEYNNGQLTINDKQMIIDMNENPSDKTLTSLNYSNGDAFKGTLKNIVVTSY